MLEFISDHWWMFVLLILIGGSGGIAISRRKDE
jgi:hypothetical protein